MGTGARGALSHHSIRFASPHRRSYLRLESLEVTNKRCFRCVGCLLIAHVPSFMKVSVSEVLNRAFTSGVGERIDSGGSQPASACTDIPSLVTMFPVVKKVRSLGCGNSKDI